MAVYVHLRDDFPEFIVANAWEFRNAIILRSSITKIFIKVALTPNWVSARNTIDGDFEVVFVRELASPSSWYQNVFLLYLFSYTIIYFLRDPIDVNKFKLRLETRHPMRSIHLISHCRKRVNTSLR